MIVNISISEKNGGKAPSKSCKVNHLSELTRITLLIFFYLCFTVVQVHFGEERKRAGKKKIFQLYKLFTEDWWE